ncbi:phospholipase A2 AP-PLA2-I-like [Apostichopus japonicus]|uniref:phospholipase A2 AP-PLA2-I-like n=1 Tax=Stichopus japonicus TaxID=307972 RepID=UPI003AB6559A
MKFLVLIILVITDVAAYRGRRSVAQFGDMISCVTDRGLIRSWADYDGYGCYCGLGGSGSPLTKPMGTAEEYGFFDGLYPECAAAMCKCDMEGALCFAASSYDKDLKSYPKDTC